MAVDPTPRTPPVELIRWFVVVRERALPVYGAQAVKAVAVARLLARRCNFDLAPKSRLVAALSVAAFDVYAMQC